MNFEKILIDFQNERRRLKFELLRIERAMQARKEKQNGQKNLQNGEEIILPGSSGKPDEEFFLGNQHL